jgi:hypothetical protein
MQAERHGACPSCVRVLQAYASLKEAISTLHPIIRNRLRGLPAYVLDYSDLIAPNRCVCMRVCVRVHTCAVVGHAGAQQSSTRPAPHA